MSHLYFSLLVWVSFWKSTLWLVVDCRCGASAKPRSVSFLSVTVLEAQFCLNCLFWQLLFQGLWKQRWIFVNLLQCAVVYFTKKLPNPTHSFSSTHLPMSMSILKVPPLKNTSYKLSNNDIIFHKNLRFFKVFQESLNSSAFRWCFRQSECTVKANMPYEVVKALPQEVELLRRRPTRVSC